MAIANRAYCQSQQQLIKFARLFFEHPEGNTFHQSTLKGILLSTLKGILFASSPCVINAFTIAKQGNSNPSWAFRKEYFCSPCDMENWPATLVTALETKNLFLPCEISFRSAGKGFLSLVLSLVWLTTRDKHLGRKTFSSLVASPLGRKKFSFPRACHLWCAKFPYHAVNKSISFPYAQEGLLYFFPFSHREILYCSLHMNFSNVQFLKSGLANQHSCFKSSLCNFSLFCKTFA